MLCSTITCSKCGPEHQTYRWQFEYALSLSIEGRGSSLTLDAALENYFKPETINDYTCIKCSIRRYLTKKTYESIEGISNEDIAQAVSFLQRISLS